MHLQSASPYPDVRVTASSRHVEAGTYRLPKAQHHRIMVHASAATRTYCNDVAKHFIRRAGDVDIVPAGQEAGFEAETSFDTLEIRLTPSLLEGVAAELGTGASLRRFDTRHLLRDMWRREPIACRKRSIIASWFTPAPQRGPTVTTSRNIS